MRAITLSIVALTLTGLSASPGQSSNPYQWRGTVLQGGAIEIKGVNGEIRATGSSDTQVEVYSKAGNMTTRADQADNKYSQADPFNADLAKAIPVSRTPYTLKFFELVNSPQGPWLQMLQRVYYTNDDLDQIIADTRSQMIAIACN